MLLGATFMAGQVYEFTTFYREGLTYDGSLLGTAFYAMTGFHGLHVAGRHPVADRPVDRRGARGVYTKEEPHLRIELGGLYWHFVDLVWVLLFTIVYLIH